MAWWNVTFGSGQWLLPPIAATIALRHADPGRLLGEVKLELSQRLGRPPVCCLWRNRTPGCSRSARATAEVLGLHSGTLFSGFVPVADAPDRE